MDTHKTQSEQIGKDWIREASFIVAFDYNAHPLAAERYGSGVPWERLREYLQSVRPDMALVQALGYWGWASFPSKVAPTPPGLTSDYVDTFCRVCRETGVRVGMYVESYQTVGNSRPFSEAERARWFQVNAQGRTSSTIFCPNSPFADEYLVPFCLEAIERYRPAAFWFDHVRTRPCYCQYCRAKYNALYGEDTPLPLDANRRAHMEMFSDASFTASLEHVSALLRQQDPDLVLCWSNANEQHYLRPVFAGSDWIASDPINPPNLMIARFDAAYRSTLGAPAHVWVPDLARFSHSRQRPPELLRAEAATIVAHGLGMTMYHIPDPLGAFGLDKLASARVASEFIRSRADFCLGNESIPHVAEFASRAHNLRFADRFQPKMKELYAMHELLSQNHIPCEVVNDDVLLKRLARYDLVTLGETRVIAPATAAALERYVENGGRVLMIGPAPLVAEPDALTAQSPPLFGLASSIGNRVARHFMDGRVAHVGRLVFPAVTLPVVLRRVDVDGNECEPLVVEKKIGRGFVRWLLADAVSEYGGVPEDTLRLDGGTKSLEDTDAMLAGRNFGAMGQSLPNALPGSQRPGGIDVRLSGMTCDPALESINYEDTPLKDPVSGPVISHPHLRRFVGDVVRAALAERWLICSDAPAGVEFVVNRRGADLYVHLVNHICGYIQDTIRFTTDSIPALAEIEFEINLRGRAASGVQAYPAGETIRCAPIKTGWRVNISCLRHHLAVRFIGAAPVFE